MSVEVFALGFMEQTMLYNAINQSLAIIGGENSAASHLCTTFRE